MIDRQLRSPCQRRPLALSPCVPSAAAAAAPVGRQITVHADTRAGAAAAHPHHLQERERGCVGGRKGGEESAKAFSGQFGNQYRSLIPVIEASSKRLSESLGRGREDERRERARDGERKASGGAVQHRTV